MSLEFVPDQGLVLSGVPLYGFDTDNNLTLQSDPSGNIQANSITLTTYANANSVTGAYVNATNTMSALNVSATNYWGIASNMITGFSVVAGTGSYNDLLNQPTIPSVYNATTNPSGYITISSVPTNVSALANDKGYLTQYQANGSFSNVNVSSNIYSSNIWTSNITSLKYVGITSNMVSGLSVVAGTGSYTDLSNKPTIPSSYNSSTNPTGYLTATALPTTGITAGSYGSGTVIPVLTVDSYGRITGISTSSSGIGSITSSQWSTSGSAVYYNSGSVGIGTASPTSLLHVNGTTTLNGNITLPNTYNTFNVPANGNFNVFCSTLTNGQSVCIQTGIGTGAYQAGQLYYNYNSSTVQSSYLNLGISYQSQTLTIDGYGNVGIGTHNASTTLYVNGSTTLNGNTSVGGTLNVSGTTSLSTTYLNTNVLYVKNDNNHYLAYDGGVDGPNLVGFSGVKLGWRGGTILTASGGNVNMSGNASVSGALSVSGTSTLTGNTSVGGTLTVSGNTTHSGYTSLGTSSTSYSALNVQLGNCTTNGAIGDWDNTYALFSSEGVGTRNGAVGIGWNSTTHTGYITSLSPNVAWRDLVITGNTVKQLSQQSGNAYTCLTGSGLGINTTSTVYPLSVYGSYNVGSVPFALYLANGGIGCQGNIYGNHILPNNNNTYLCGNLGDAWNAVWSYNFSNPSDGNIKQMVDLPYGLNEVMEMPTIAFRWKPNQTSNIQTSDITYGVNARAMYNSNLCTDCLYTKDADLGSNIYICPDELIPICMNAIKQLKKELDETRRYLSLALGGSNIQWTDYSPAKINLPEYFESTYGAGVPFDTLNLGGSNIGL